MEDMFSLGSVALCEYTSSNSKTPTGEMAELFVTQVLGTPILKLKYGNVVYAVSKNTNDTAYIVHTTQGKRYFYYADFDELKKSIKANNPINK